MDEPFVVPADILRALKKDATTWKNFHAYRPVRIGWIEATRGRLETFQTRLAYFLKMTAKNKRFGMVRCIHQVGHLSEASVTHSSLVIRYLATSIYVDPIPLENRASAG